MPETLTCPVCQQTASLPDNLLGGKVFCPRCGAAFTASRQPLDSEPAPSSPHPPDERVASELPRIAAARVLESHRDDAYGGSRPAIDAADAQGWWSAHAGLRLLAWSHGLYLVALGVAALLLVFVFVEALNRSSRRSGRDSETVLIILSVTLGLTWLSSWIMMLIAGSFLVLIPNRRNTRALAIAAMSWSALLLIYGLRALPYGLYGPGYGEFYGPRFQLIVLLVLEIIRLTLLACVLHAIVRALQLRRAGTSRALIIITPTLMFGVLVLGVVAAVAESGVAGWVVISVLGIGSFIAILVIGLVLMMKIRQAIRHGLPELAV
jgi:hypothetical protein